MAQWIRALAALTEAPGSIASTHTCIRYTHGRYTNINTGKIPIRINLLKRNTILIPIIY